MTAHDDLVDRCRAVCPDFVATSPIRRHRKSETLAGTAMGMPVIAKRTRSASRVWAWYAAREIAVYRALAPRWDVSASSIRLPVLVAASEDLLVIERIEGAPLATKRRPYAKCSAVLDDLLATVAVLEQSQVSLPDLPPPSHVRTQLRERLLEDPTSEGAWIRDGLLHCGRRGLVDEAVAEQARAAVEGAPLVFAHGDVLLRNVIAAHDGGRVTLVDWECAGLHLRDWDRALLWTQLDDAGRQRVERSLDVARLAAFRALVVFALARELQFVYAFADKSASAIGRVRDDLAGAIAKLDDRD